MSNHEHQFGCGCCSQSRRSFLTLAAGAGLVSLPLSQTVYGDESKAKMVVRVLFALHAVVQPRPDWPNIGFDFQPVMDKTMNALAAGCPDVVFLSTMSTGPEQTKKIVEQDRAEGKVDGYIVMQMNCWNRVVQDAVESGKPVLYADFLYGGSGGYLVYTAGMLRAETPNFAHLSSGRVDDLVAAARCFPLAQSEGGLKAFVDGVTKVRLQRMPKNIDMTCKEDKVDVLSTTELLKALKGKKIIEVEKGWHPVGAELKESLGIEIVQIPFTELNEAWEKADKDQAREVVAKWKTDSAGIEKISDSMLLNSARMYLAQQACMKAHDACAITINCLGGFYGEHIFAYPCLGFHQLLNEGLIGACECDTKSTLTMVVMTTLTKGRPGYISDPVMDLATKQIIYAHCVASNLPFGPKGPANPFTIMSHSEDRKGASVRSTLPVGYMTTTLEIAPEKKQILFHQGVTVANSTEDRACRTKIAAVPVGDFEKLYTEWDQWGWHRVTYYGDLKESVFALAAAIGFDVVEEA